MSEILLAYNPDLGGVLMKGLERIRVYQELESPVEKSTKQKVFSNSRVTQFRDDFYLASSTTFSYF